MNISHSIQFHWGEIWLIFLNFKTHILNKQIYNINYSVPMGKRDILHIETRINYLK